MKKTALLIITILILLCCTPVLAASTTTDTSTDDTPQVYYYKGEVLRVETITFEQDNSLSYDEIKQISDIKIKQGDFEGRVYTIENNVKYSDPKQLILSVGDNVMLSAELTDDGTEIQTIHIYDYYRINQVIAVIVIAVILLCGVCWLKGLRALISMVIVSLGLILYFVPLMLNGYSPILLIIPLCAVIAFLNIAWDLGVNIKGFSALLGTIAGISIAGITGYLFEHTAHLIGLGETELNMLYYMPNHLSLDYTGLTSACVMLIALGAVIDICTDMVFEMAVMKDNNPYISRRKLFLFGLRSGRGYMSRNVNTVFFILIASMLPIWILFVGYSTPFVEMVNMDVLSIQLFRAMGAIIGIVVCMPVTSYFYTILGKRNSLY